MSNKRYDTIRDIVRQSLADMRHLGNVIMDFGPADALFDREDAMANGLGAVEGFEASERQDDYDLLAKASARLCSDTHPDEVTMLLDMIRQRIADLPLEVTE